MLKAALEEELGDEHLKIKASLLACVLLVEVVLLDQGLDLDEASCDRLDLRAFDRLARGGVSGFINSAHSIQS